MGVDFNDVSEQEELPTAPESSPEEVEVIEEPEPQAQEPESTEEPVQAPAEEPAKVQEESPVEKPISNKTNERIRNLANENRELKAKLETFANQPAPELDGDMTVDDLNRLVNERAMQAADLTLRSMQVEGELKVQHTKWADDITATLGKYPELDSESPLFNKRLSEHLALGLMDSDKNARLDINAKEYIEEYMQDRGKVSAQAQEEGKSQATARLAKQMAEGAITPTAKPSSEAEEFTDVELAEMRVKNPQKYMDLIDRI